LVKDGFVVLAGYDIRHKALPMDLVERRAMEKVIVSELGHMVREARR
jgi:hypothetical protein